jgi:hypothetical protein
MAQRKIYGEFFEKLELRLRKEMTSWDYVETRVVNHFVLHNQYNVSAEARLRSGIKICVVCDSLFPTQPPKVFCKGSYQGSNISPLTKEIDYDSYFQWTKTSTISRLIGEIDKHYLEHPPRINETNQEILDDIEKAKLVIGKEMKSIDRNQLMLMIDPLEQIMLRDPGFRKELIMRSVETDMAKKRINTIVNKITDKGGRMKRKSS